MGVVQDHPTQYNDKNPCNNTTTIAHTYHNQTNIIMEPTGLTPDAPTSNKRPADIMVYLSPPSAILNVTKSHPPSAPTGLKDEHLISLKSLSIFADRLHIMHVYKGEIPRQNNIVCNTADHCSCYNHMTQVHPSPNCHQPSGTT